MQLKIKSSIIIGACSVFMAFASNASSQTTKKSREKHIVREGASKKGSSNYIDFDKADISGQRKTPLGSMINQGVSDKNYDFIRIRFDWHGEMAQSARSLDTGK